MIGAAKAALGRGERPVFVDSAVNASTSDTASCSMPAGAAAGLLAIAVIHTAGGSFTTPSGWTAVQTATSSNASGVPFSQTYVFWKLLTGSGGSFSAGPATSTSWIVSLTIWDRADKVAPIPLSGKTEVSSGVASSVTAPVIVAARDNVVNLAAYSANSGSFGSVPTITPNRGTERTNSTSNSVLRGVVYTDTNASSATRSATITTATGTPSAVAFAVVGR